LKELAAGDRVTLRKSLRNGGLREGKETGSDRDRNRFCLRLIVETQVCRIEEHLTHLSVSLSVRMITWLLFVFALLFSTGIQIPATEMY